MENKAFDHSKYTAWIDPNQVTPYERNAKIHDEKQIRNIVNSIRRFGWQQDTVITSDNVLVIGHGRRLAAIQIGCEMPYHVIDKKADDLTDDDIRELRIADNQTNAETGFDFDVMNLEISDLDFDGFEFDFSEYTGETETVDVREDEPPVPPDEPTSKRGDIYQLGEHRLMCGDSTDAGDVDKLLDGADVKLLLTDPPYNCDVGNCERPNSSNNGVHILNDSMSEGTFIRFLTKALSNAERHMQPGAPYYIFYAGLHHIEFETAIRNIEKFKLHEQLIWVKSHFVLGRNSDYQWMHECCLYGWKEGAAHYFTDSRAEMTVLEDKQVKLSTLKKDELIAICEKLMGINQSTTVLRAGKPSSADLHPTVKPQELLAGMLKNSSQRGWPVLDLFGGSGSTLIACQQVGRKCYIMELDPHYCDVIRERSRGERPSCLTGSRAKMAKLDGGQKNGEKRPGAAVHRENGEK